MSAVPYSLPGPGDLWAGPTGNEDGPDTTDARSALAASVTFVGEAIGESDLAPLARAWIAKDPIELSRLVGLAVASYLDFRIDEALDKTPDDEADDALRNLEHAYRDEQQRIQRPQAPQPFDMVGYANSLVARIAQVQS